jgi:hypothetical protein
MKTLNVKETNNLELRKNWEVSINSMTQLYVRCNYKGDVNWPKTSIYTLEELLKRGSVKIIGKC